MKCIRTKSFCLWVSNQNRASDQDHLVQIKYAIYWSPFSTYRVHWLMLCHQNVWNSQNQSTYLFNSLLELLWVGFNSLLHHVVLEILDKEEHTLSEGKRPSVPNSCRPRQQLHSLVNYPNPVDINNWLDNLRIFQKFYYTQLS